MSHPIHSRSRAEAGTTGGRFLPWVVALVLAAGLPCSVLAQGTSKRSEIPEFINGVDVSFLQHYEDSGVVFTEDGVAKDPLEIFKSHGVNVIRLRIWHTPTPDWAFNGLEATLAMARRVKEADLALLLDFHYSDWWADPGKQNKPAAWAGAPFPILKDSLREYTEMVVRRLSDQGTLPEIIQIGNEITNGMLWDSGRVGGAFDNTEQWQQLAELIVAADSGIVDGLGDGDVKPAVMIHIDRGGDPDGTGWFFGNLTAQGVDFDMIGLSYYPFWHGALSRLQQTLRIASLRYKKDIVVVETAYPWTLDHFDNQNNFVWQSSQLLDGYPATVEGQLKFLQDLKAIVKATPLGYGRGFAYWEPAFIAAPGLPTPWDNLTLFDDKANALASLEAFNDGDPSAAEPADLPNQANVLAVVNYPNPFSRSTTLEYSLDEAEAIRITVFDLTGRLVASYGNGQLQTAGVHTVQIDGTRLARGVYLAQLERVRSGATSRILIHRE